MNEAMMLLTSAVGLAEIGKAPDVSQPHAEAQDGEEELEAGSPLLAVVDVNHGLRGEGDGRSKDVRFDTIVLTALFLYLGFPVS